MATLEVPAAYVGHLKSAAIYTLREEADRVHEAERAVWANEGGREKELAIAEADLSGVRPLLDRMIPIAGDCLAATLPAWDALKDLDEESLVDAASALREGTITRQQFEARRAAVVRARAMLDSAVDAAATLIPVTGGQSVVA